MAIFDIFRNKQAQKSTLSHKEKQTVLRVIRRQEAIIRRDIASWRTARLEATLADEPKQHRLRCYTMRSCWMPR